MKIYLIRRAGTSNILGLFWAVAKLDLWWAVDEWGDPADYEYLELKNPGSLAFPEDEPTAHQWGSAKAGDDEADVDLPEFSWQGAAHSELFIPAIYNMADFAWKRLPHANKPGGGVHELCKRTDKGRSSTKSI